MSRIKSNNCETGTWDAQFVFQGKGGTGCHQGRTKTLAELTQRCSPLPDHGLVGSVLDGGAGLFSGEGR